MKTSLTKRVTSDFLELTLRMYVDRVQLRLDRRVCLKCDVCALVCPQGAVSVRSGDAELEIDIDARRCLLCEICSHFCPVGAVTLTFNGLPKTIFAEHRGLAPFFPKIDLDQGRCPEGCAETPPGEVHWCRQQLQLVTSTPYECPKHCHRCLEACPRQAIVLDETGVRTLPQPDQCLRCTQCLQACRYEAIQVNPQFRGRLLIEDRRCPPDCLKCINLCPVKAIVREGERVYLRVEVCSYCGVCRNICDDEAITLIREEVVAEPGRFSQAWDEAVAKLLK